MAKNKSISEIICDYIKKQKLSPIPVQTLNEEAESTRYFGGDLKEFIAAAKTLGAKGIFVEELYLEDDEFYYDSGNLRGRTLPRRRRVLLRQRHGR